MNFHQKKFVIPVIAAPIVGLVFALHSNPDLFEPQVFEAPISEEAKTENAEVLADCIVSEINNRVDVYFEGLRYDLSHGIGLSDDRLESIPIALQIRADIAVEACLPSQVFVGDILPELNINHQYFDQIDMTHLTDRMNYFKEELSIRVHDEMDEIIRLRQKDSMLMVNPYESVPA